MHFFKITNEKHFKYSIKTFTRTWYNKQKQDSELMTEKIIHIFFFFFQSPKHTIVNQLHMYDGIGYKQDKEQTREKERKIKNKSDRFHSDFTVLVFV